MGPPLPVIPAQAGIQGHTHKSRLPPWTPDQVRGDKKRGPLSVLRAFSARSAGHRGPRTQKIFQNMRLTIILNIIIFLIRDV